MIKAMALNRLQIAQVNDAIRVSVEAVCPDKMVNGVMEEIVAGAQQPWSVYDQREDGTRKMLALITTKIIESRMIGERILFVFLVYAPESLTLEAVQVAVGALETYARARKCNAVEGDTPMESLIRASKRFGYETVSTKIRKEIA